jgi:3-isopropylmalate/(R)-2-methylmalate dehydratase large subunit
LIGGATGSSIEDLRLAAKMLKGKKVPITMRLTVSPETSKVYDQAMEEGLVSIFIDANVQIIAPGYGSISRPSKAVVGDGETQIVTNYWNYMGYNGSKQSRTLIASTQTAIECALKQEIGTKLSVVEEV